MISTLITRDRADFSAYIASLTSSASASAFDNSASNYYTSYVSISNGISLTEIFANANGTASHSDSAVGGYNASNSQQGGTTSYADATLTSESQSNSAESYFLGTDSDGSVTSSYLNTLGDSSSTSTSASLSDTLFTTQESAYTYPRTTTADVPLTNTHFIISGSGTNGFLTTETQAVTAVGTTTDEGAATRTTNVTTALEFGTYYDLGGIYSADTDWLWQLQNTSYSPQLVSDIGASTDIITVWPIAVTQEQSVLSVADSSLLTGTIAIAADTSALSYQVLYSNTTTSSTILSGDSIPFDTTFTSVSLWTTDTAATIVGNNDNSTITAATTQSATATTWRVDTYLATVTYPDGFNTSTVELVQLTSFFDTTTVYSIPPAYLASSSSSFSGAYSEMGATIQGTDLFYQGFNVVGWGGTAQGINPIAPFDAFVAPSDLRSDGNPYNFADNLNFPIRIPFLNFSNVFSNAATPYPTAFTTIGSDSHSFAYSWISDTLKYTEWSTYEAGDSTLTDKTKSSGVFSSSSPMDSYYADGGTVYGGFPAIPTAAESVYFPPRAVIGTSIDTDGASTTYRTLVTDFTYSEISETAVIEQAIPAFIIVTQLQADPGGQSFFEYPRN